MAAAEQFTELQRKNLEAAMRLAQISIENSQRIMELQVETARTLFEESLKNAKALAAARDPKEALELRGAYAQVTGQQMMNAARRIAEIAAETQSQFGRMVTEQLTGGGREMMESLQQAMSFNPAAGKAAEGAVGAMQQAFDVMRGAFEQMAKGSTAAMENLMATAPKAAAGPAGKRTKS